MLTFEQLQTLYPSVAPYVSAKNILVEYLQFELLDCLFKEKQSSHLSFIGGTALRICYQGSRFSEDIDFDNFGLSFSEFQSLLDKTVQSMSLKGFKMEYRFVEKGAFHCYIKFPHLLFEQGLSPLREEKILVRIDTVSKKKNYTPSLFLLNKFDVYRDILTAPPEILLSQKLMTILQRKREKGRDFFDVSFLYGFTQPNREYIREVTGYTWKKFVIELQKKCESLDFNFLATDVQPFLVKPDQSLRVKNFMRFLKEYIV